MKHLENILFKKEDLNKKIIVFVVLLQVLVNFMIFLSYATVADFELP